MNIGSVFTSLINGVKLVFGSKAAQEVAQAVISDTLAAVAALKDTEVGTAVVNLISAYEHRNDLTNAEKFEAVVKAVQPLLVTFLSKGGVEKSVEEVESIVRALVQVVFNDVKSSKAGSVAKAIIALVKSLF